MQLNTYHFLQNPLEGMNSLVDTSDPPYTNFEELMRCHLIIAKVVNLSASVCKIH